MISDPKTGTAIDEIADRVFRISTPVHIMPGGFTFNQYLLVDDSPLLFHTGPRRMFALVRDAIARVMPVARLRYVSFSHVEADECGALNEFLAAAPEAEPLCGQVAALVSVNDIADRPARALADGEILSLGRHEVQWFDTAHLPHAWECGMLFERGTRTLFCSDLFTEGGAEHPAVSEGDILTSSEAFRAAMDYYAHTPNDRALLAKLAGLRPAMLARMHGSAWRGDGAAMLMALADALDRGHKAPGQAQAG
jgi:flavorubredoxin